jgi:hypothetical protein
MMQHEIRTSTDGYLQDPHTVCRQKVSVSIRFKFTMSRWSRRRVPGLTT